MRRLSFILLLLTIASGTALAKDIKTTLSASDSGEIWFNTAGSFKKPAERGGFYPLTNDSIPIFGELRFPEGNGPFPAVILAHGCAGPGYAEPTWVPVLKEWGYATFVVNSYRPRGVSDTCTDDTKLSTLERIPDVYGALRLLATHPKINKDAIALMGFSQGGRVTNASSYMWAKKNFAADGNPTFKAFFPFYPYCNAQSPVREEIYAPIRIHTGELDDWTPAQPCVEWVEGLKAKGFDASITVYKGAHHSFDNAVGSVEYLRNVTNGATCVPVFENIQGPYPTTLSPAGCVKKGATVGRSPKAIEEAKSVLRPQLDELLRSK